MWTVGGIEPLILNLGAGWEESISRSRKFIPKEGSHSTHRISVGWAVPVKRRASRSGVPRGGGLGCSNPPPEILKALQNRAKLNPIVKTVKNC